MQKITNLIVECRINDEIVALADHTWEDIFQYSMVKKEPVVSWIVRKDIVLRHPRLYSGVIHYKGVCRSFPPFTVKAKLSLYHVLDGVQSLDDARERVKTISIVSDDELNIEEDRSDLEESLTNEQLISNQYTLFFKPLVNPVCERMMWFAFLKTSLSIDQVTFRDWRYFQRLLGTELPEDCHLFGLQLHLSGGTTCALSQPFAFIAQIRDSDHEDDIITGNKVRDMMIPAARTLLQSTLPLMLLSRYSGNDLEDGKSSRVVVDWMYVYGLIISPEKCRFFVLTPKWDQEIQEWGYLTASLYFAYCYPNSNSLRARMAGMMQSVRRNVLYLRSRLEEEVKRLGAT